MSGLHLYSTGIIFCTFILLFFFLYKNGRFFRLIVVALGVRIALSFVFPEIVGTADISDYQPYLISFVESLRDGELIRYFEPEVSFYTLLYPGWIYTVFGADGLWLIRIANAVVSLLIIIPLNMINNRIWNRDIAVWQAGILLFWPSYLQLSVEVGRTPISVVLVLFTVATLLRAIEVPRKATVSIAVVTLILNTLIRTHYAFYAVMFVTAMYIYKILSIRNREIQIGTMVVGTGILSIALYIYNQTVYSALSLETIRTLAESNARGGSAYLVQLYPSTFLDFTWYIPIQAFYFLFSPLPWDMIENLDILSVIAGLQSLILIAILTITLIKMRKNIQLDWRIFAIFAAVLLTAFAFGAVTKNAGAAVRWRLPSALLLMSVTTSLLATEYSLHRSPKES